MIIIRSFDVNKPGEDAETLKGGGAGGTILKGVLKVGDKISGTTDIEKDFKFSSAATFAPYISIQFNL